MSASVVQVEHATIYRIALDQPVTMMRPGPTPTEIVGVEVQWHPHDGIRKAWLVTRQMPPSLTNRKLFIRLEANAGLDHWRPLILAAIRATDTRLMTS